MMRVADHPVVRNLLETGYPDGMEPEYPVCPVCGRECEDVYQDRFGDVVGCDACVTARDAWDTPECFPE